MVQSKREKLLRAWGIGGELGEVEYSTAVENSRGTVTAWGIRGECVVMRGEVEGN